MCRGSKIWGVSIKNISIQYSVFIEVLNNSNPHSILLGMCKNLEDMYLKNILS